MKFAGKNIWGTQFHRMIGPKHDYRALREYLPGIDGFRVYRLGRKHAGIFLCSGRLVEFSRGALERKISEFGSLVNGRLYVFESAGGVQYRNCLLESYDQQGEPQAITLSDGITPAVTVRVQGVVVRASE